MLCGKRLAWHNSITQIFACFLPDISINSWFLDPAGFENKRNPSPLEGNIEKEKSK